MKRTAFSILFTVVIAIFLIVPVANAELTASQSLHGIAVSGVRSSAGAWGTGAWNYAAGATMTTLLPTTNEGWLQAGINSPDGDSTFGSGTGYKLIFQFYQDANNVLAFGIIKDPGAAPWGGVTVMVEGLANGQPVGGYWPQGHMGFSDGGYYSIFISWSTTQISFSIDDLLVGIYNMDLTSPSFSVMGCARMPGDMVHGVLEIYSWSFLKTGLMDPPAYQMWTADNATGTITPIGIAQSPFGY